MAASLTLEMTPGCAIERACEDAQRVANLLFIDVEFSFNGVRCLARPQGYADLLAERQQAEQSRKPRFPLDTKFASSDPRHHGFNPPPAASPANPGPINASDAVEAGVAGQQGARE